jgi:hypothetical protein
MYPVPSKGSLANVTRLGQGAVAAVGVTRRTTLKRQPKLLGPGAPAVRHWGPMTAGARRGHTALHRFVPAAVVRLLSESDAARKGNATGGRAEQASNIARGTPESWRTCGLTTRTRLHRKASSRLSAARRSGPWVPRGPGVPRALDLFRTRTAQASGAKRAARTRGANFWRNVMQVRAANSLSPLPLAGEGGREQEQRERPGEG